MKFPDTLDNTTLGMVAECPRKAYYRSLLYLEKNGGVSIHLHAGKSYAAALETFRKNFYSPSHANHKDLFASLEAATRTLFLSYGYDEERESEKFWAESPKSAIGLLQTLIASLQEYPPLTDPVKPYMINGEPAVELSFTLEFDFAHPDTADPVLFHGRYDMLAETAGALYVFDDKTTSALGKSWRQQWDLRAQFTGYTLGAKQHDLPIAGAIVRGHCILKTDYKFEQSITYRKEYILDQWWEDAHALTHQFISYYNRAKEMDVGGLSARHAFPTLGTFNGACASYGGCQFKPLCESKNPERWLSDYKISQWDPKNPDVVRPYVSAKTLIKVKQL